MSKNSRNHPLYATAESATATKMIGPQMSVRVACIVSLKPPDSIHRDDIGKNG